MTNLSHEYYSSIKMNKLLIPATTKMGSIYITFSKCQDYGDRE